MCIFLNALYSMTKKLERENFKILNLSELNLNFKTFKVKKKNKKTHLPHVFIWSVVMVLNHFNNNLTNIQSEIESPGRNVRIEVGSEWNQEEKSTRVR